MSEPIKELYKICQEERTKLAALLAETSLERNTLKADNKALQDLLREAYPIIRGRHSSFTYGPRDLVERIQQALAACQEEVKK